MFEPYRKGRSVKERTKALDLTVNENGVKILKRKNELQGKRKRNENRNKNSILSNTECITTRFGTDYEVKSNTLINS